MVANRPKHPKKEGEEALGTVEAMGWDAVFTGKYYRLRCRCGGLHQTYLHISPSNPNHFKEKVGYCRRVCDT